MRYCTIFCVVSILMVTLLACKTETPTPAVPVTPTVADTVPFMRGIDLSFTPEISAASGEIYKDTSGNPITLLPYLKQNGINTARIRLWYNPTTGHSTLDEVAAFALKLKAAGLDFYLDFHYADSWADPGTQPTPTAWKNAPYDALKDSVYQYTKRVLTKLVAQNTAPQWVQIGNETNAGMLWNIGRVGGSYDSQWAQYAALTSAGCKATREVSKASKIIIHYAGYSGSQDFFQRLANFDADFDVIGLSYYPWWHGKDLTAMATQVNSLAATFKKPVVFAETGYPFTVGYNDYTNNVFGDSTLLSAAYPASPTGQAAFMQKLLDISRAIPNNLGRGACYWAGDWVAYRGSTASNGSTWENLALFDFQNRALPALGIFGKQ